MSPNGYKQEEWQAPSRDALEDSKIGWINEICQDGEAFNTNQRGYRDQRKALDIISGICDPNRQTGYRSTISSGRLKTNIRTTVAGLANIRPIWGFHADNAAYQQNAKMLNMVSRALYFEGQWDQSIKEALQWAAGTQTGWIRPVFRRDQGGWGQGRMCLDTFGSPSVLPFQLPENGDYNSAYAVTLMTEVPIYMAHAMFPEFQDRLRPTSSKYWYSSEIRQSAQSNAGKWWPFKKRRDRDLRKDVFCPLRYTTIIDLDINTTGQTIPMGATDSSWYYEVPSFDPQKNNANDARLYPYRRLIISSENCVLYDGPTFNWHGELDLIPVCMDKWPWEPNGFSMVHDAYGYQEAIDQIDRGNLDKIAAQMDRPLAYAMDAVDKRDADGFDPMQPRARIAYDSGLTDKPFSSPVPEDTYHVTPESLKYKEMLEAGMDFLFQTRDIVELGKARALGKGMDQLEALMAANGPIVKDMCRVVETALSKIGNQMRFMIPQYLTTARIMQYIGEENMSPETFDYDPATLIPSHLPGENPMDLNGNKVKSPTPLHKRARWFAQNVRFSILPHSAHEITQMTFRLTQIQLKQRGAPLPWATVMESCDIPNVGKPHGNTVQEQYHAEQEEDLQQLVRMQKLAQSMGLQLPEQGGGGKKKAGGRPPTAQKPPQQKVKGDGRPVITES